MTTTDDGRQITLRWVVRREYRTERGPLVVEEDVPDNMSASELITSGPHDIRALAVASITCAVICDDAMTLEQCELEDGYFRTAAGVN